MAYRMQVRPKYYNKFMICETTVKPLQLVVMRLRLLAALDSYFSLLTYTISLSAIICMSQSSGSHLM